MAATASVPMTRFTRHSNCFFARAFSPEYIPSSSQSRMIARYAYNDVRFTDPPRIVCTTWTAHDRERGDRFSANRFSDLADQSSVRERGLPDRSLPTRGRRASSSGLRRAHTFFVDPRGRRKKRRRKITEESNAREPKRHYEVGYARAVTPRRDAARERCCRSHFYVTQAHARDGLWSLAPPSKRRRRHSVGEHGRIDAVRARSGIINFYSSHSLSPRSAIYRLFKLVNLFSSNNTKQHSMLMWDREV